MALWPSAVAFADDTLPEEQVNEIERRLKVNELMWLHLYDFRINEN